MRCAARCGGASILLLLLLLLEVWAVGAPCAVPDRRNWLRVLLTAPVPSLLQQLQRNRQDAHCACFPRAIYVLVSIYAIQYRHQIHNYAGETRSRTIAVATGCLSLGREKPRARKDTRTWIIHWLGTILSVARAPPPSPRMSQSTPDLRSFTLSE